MIVERNASNFCGKTPVNRRTNICDKENTSLSDNENKVCNPILSPSEECPVKVENNKKKLENSNDSEDPFDMMFEEMNETKSLSLTERMKLKYGKKIVSSLLPRS